MTERPELDAWLDEADRVLDQDAYGRHWTADAMTVRYSEPEPIPYPVVDGIVDDPAGAPTGDDLAEWVRAVRARRAAAGGQPPLIYTDTPQRLAVAYGGARVWTRPAAAEGEWREVEGVEAVQWQWDGNDVAGDAYDRMTAAAAGQLAIYGEVFQDADTGLIFDRELGRPLRLLLIEQFSQLFEQVAEAMQITAEAAGQMFSQISDGLRAATTVVEELQQTAARPPARMCPRHGEEMRAGQCRRCQRDEVRQASRRRR